MLNQIADLPFQFTQDSFGNVFITKGVSESYPCVSAHFDEVHQPCVRNIQEADGIIFAINEKGEREGIGADDKNGVWVTIELLKSLDVMKVALFVREEKATFKEFDKRIETMKTEEE